MSQTINIKNYGANNVLEKLQLNADVAASASPVTLNVINNNNIAANDYIVLGGLGTENSELVQVTSVSGANSIVVPAVAFAHTRYSDVTKIFGNSLTVMRAPNVDGTQPADSAFVTFSNNTIAIDIDQGQTIYTDPNGSSDYWYKFVYTNTTTVLSTNIADSQAVRGAGIGNYATLAEIRNSAGFNRAPYITDDMVDEKRQAAQATIDGALVGIYPIPFTEPINATIRNMTILLAAGWLLADQYDANSTRGQNAKMKIESVTNKDKTGYLDRLQSGSLKLTNTAGADTTSANNPVATDGWPDDSAAAANKIDGGGDFLFHIGGTDNADRDY